MVLPPPWGSASLTTGGAGGPFRPGVPCEEIQPIRPDQPFLDRKTPTEGPENILSLSPAHARGRDVSARARCALPPRDRRSPELPRADERLRLRSCRRF